MQLQSDSHCWKLHLCTVHTAYVLLSRAVKFGGGGGVQCVATGVFTGTQSDVVMQLASRGDNVVQSLCPIPQFWGLSVATFGAAFMRFLYTTLVPCEYHLHYKAVKLVLFYCIAGGMFCYSVEIHWSHLLSKYGFYSNVTLICKPWTILKTCVYFRYVIQPFCGVARQKLILNTQLLRFLLPFCTL